MLHFYFFLNLNTLTVCRHVIKVKPSMVRLIFILSVTIAWKRRFFRFYRSSLAFVTLLAMMLRHRLQHLQHTIRKCSTSKVWESSKTAVNDVKCGSVITFGGFGLCGIPENLIAALKEKGSKNLICISNDAGVDDFGLGQLISNDQVRRLHASYVGEHKGFSKFYNSGKLEVVFTPQGTLAGQ